MPDPGACGAGMRPGCPYQLSQRRAAAACLPLAALPWRHRVPRRAPPATGPAAILKAVHLGWFLSAAAGVSAVAAGRGSGTLLSGLQPDSRPVAVQHAATPIASKRHSTHMTLGANGGPMSC